MSDSGTEWKTLRVRGDAYELAKEQKEEAGRTWSEQLVRPDGEQDTEWTENEIRQVVREELERKETGSESIDEREKRIRNNDDLTSEEKTRLLSDLYKEDESA